MEPLLTIALVADILGVRVQSARTYHERAQRRRREGTVRPHDMPEPDAHVGRSPRWKQSTIKEWAGRRGAPGRPKGPNRD